MARRESYLRKNAANNDVYAAARWSGLAMSEVVEERGRSQLVDRIEAEERETTGPGAYVESEEYRAALARVRELLPRNPRNKVRVTPALQAAFRALERAGGKKGF